MSFRLTEEMADFFVNIDKSKIKGESFLELDKFYACLMLGLRAGEFNKTAKFKDPFLASGARWPEAYREYDTYLLGLLVEAEIRRRQLDSKDRDLMEQETVRLLDPSADAAFGLSEKGIELMNAYAARGFELLREKMTPPQGVESFLASYAQLFWEDDEDAALAETA